MKYDVYFALTTVAKFHKARGLPDPDAIWKELRQGKVRDGLFGRILSIQRKVLVNLNETSAEELYFLFVIREYPEIRAKILCGQDVELEAYPYLKRLYDEVRQELNIERGDEYEEEAAVFEWKPFGEVGAGAGC